MNNIPNDDWRLLQYDGFLDGETFSLEKFVSSGDNDHEHCRFCWQKITDLPIKDADFEGYRTFSSKTGHELWVCKECFNDFRNMFDFKLK